MSDENKLPNDIAEMNFEQALSELERIVDQLERGEVDLEASIDIYTRGTYLKNHCEAKLSAARARIDKIVVGAEGSLSTEEAKIS